jgi:hypothetical protein
VSIELEITKVEKVLDIVGKDVEKGLQFVIKYAAPISAIAAIAFPGETAATAGVLASVNLVQTVVLEVKQKYAALPAGTPTSQMLQDELALVEPAVTALLKQENITYSTAQIESLINLVVAAINAQNKTA